MGLLFFTPQLLKRLLYTAAFGLSIFSLHIFSTAQEGLYSETIKTRTYRQEFKEGKFKPLYNPSIYDNAQGPITRFDPIEHEEFSMIETEMRYMIEARNKNQIINHLCAIGYVLKGGDREVVVVWREAGLLIRWWGGNVEKVKNLGFHYAGAMFWSPSISLHRLVDDRNGFLGNGSIAYREDAEGTIADCEKHGKQYVIEPFTPPPPDE